MQLVCAHMPEGIGSRIPSWLGRRYLSISCSRSHNRHSAPVHNGGSACVGEGSKLIFGPQRYYCLDTEIKAASGYVSSVQLMLPIWPYKEHCFIWQHFRPCAIPPHRICKIRDLSFFFLISLDHYFKAVWVWGAKDFQFLNKKIYKQIKNKNTLIHMLL